MKASLSRITFCLLFCLSLSSLSCGKAIEPKKINIGQSTYFRPEQMHTIAVLPFRYDGDDLSISEEVTHELTLQILQLDRFEVIDHYKVAAVVEEEAIDELELNDAMVKRIGRKLKASALLIGELSSYKSSDLKFHLFRSKPSIGLSARMVSLREKVPTTIWSINDHFDSRDQAVKALATIRERKKIEDSVSVLIKVVCRAVAQTLNF